MNKLEESGGGISVDIFDKIFGKKLFFHILMLILGVLVFFENFSTKIIGAVVIIISFFGIIYESKLRFYIKFYKNIKTLKSPKESFIADYLEKKKIKYIYEPSLKLGKDILHPDFFLPEFDVYVEYWGKWNTDFEYRKECRHKKQLYEKYEKSLVELYPDNLISINQLDWKFTERLLRILKEDRS